jgi:hypothetical protein
MPRKTNRASIGGTGEQKFGVKVDPGDYQLAQFKTIEKAPGGEFVIPGSDISGDYDLMYYFEALSDNGSGWFQPDPLTQTPYHVVGTSGKKEKGQPFRTGPLFLVCL